MREARVDERARIKSWVEGLRAIENSAEKWEASTQLNSWGFKSKEITWVEWGEGSDKRTEK